MIPSITSDIVNHFSKPRAMCVPLPVKKWLSNPNSRLTLPLRYKGDGKIHGRSIEQGSRHIL